MIPIKKYSGYSHYTSTYRNRCCKWVFFVLMCTCTALAVWSLRSGLTQNARELILLSVIFFSLSGFHAGFYVALTLVHGSVYCPRSRHIHYDAFDPGRARIVPRNLDRRNGRQ